MSGSAQHLVDRIPSRRILVTVGSDHHRFDRLVGWVDRWAAQRGLGADDVLVQHGPATAPTHVAGIDFVPHDDLLRLMGDADIVVTQGGPMSMVEARQQGRRPIVVARSAALDEVVDDHQHAFCRRVVGEGWIVLAETERELVAALDVALADPSSVRIDADPLHDAIIASSVDRFGRVADQVLALGQRREAQQPTVLVLGGFGRSGSTLLERALGEVPHVAALGEVLHLWERGLRDNDRCGCGSSFSKCPFWIAVGDRAFGGWAAIDAEEALADRRAVVRNRNLPALVTGLASPSWRLRRARLLRRTSALYAAASDEAGAQVLVDSSKHPAYAFLVRGVRARVRGVLVVRDPRGVAYSWSKTVARPEVVGGTTRMPRYSVAASGMRWALYAALFEALRLARIPVLVVRYEDLVDEPGATLRSVLAFAGHPELVENITHVENPTDGSSPSVTLAAHHTVAGNPMRFQTGRVELRLDEAWQTAMPGRERAMVERITAPLRGRYRYR